MSTPVTGSPSAERPVMRDYGVDEADWEPLPWSWATERLTGSRSFWLVTVSGDGRPHALPVWGVWSEDDLRLAFGCGPRSRKARNLRADPRAVVMTDSTAECLSLEGTARIAEERRRDRWIERYLAKYQPLAPSLDAGFLRANLLFEFRPERGFAIIEEEPEFATRATKWVFDQRP